MSQLQQGRDYACAVLTGGAEEHYAALGFADGAEDQRHLCIHHAEVAVRHVLRGVGHGIAAGDGQMAVIEAGVCFQRTGSPQTFCFRAQIDQQGDAVLQQKLNIRLGRRNGRIAAQNPEAARQYRARIGGGLKQTGHDDSLL